jgi:hypothetical protein
MSTPDLNQQPELQKAVETLAKRVRALTVAVILMSLALFLLAAAVFGDLVNYYAFDPMLVGGVAAGCALVGFGVGWFAGKKA